MATGWMKSLQCKSRAFDDVVHPTNPKHILLPSSSCRNSTQNLKDVIVDSRKPTAKPEAHQDDRHHHRRHRHHHHHHHHQHHKPRPNPTSVSTDPVVAVPTRSRSARSHADHNHHQQPIFPSLTELPEGHPSRNVVEIIFHTSWGVKPFSGQIEMIFKVQNGPRTAARFDEYREAVKTRAGVPCTSTLEENARCAADGNEMMRFHCLGPASGGVLGQEACGGAWTFPGGGGKGGGGGVICTFSGSGGAHESAGGGRGRRAMLVCRVIAGRVSKRVGLESLLDGRVGFDSVSGENGDLLVFDPRAVLPCFLIIYKL